MGYVAYPAFVSSRIPVENSDKPTVLNTNEKSLLITDIAIGVLLVTIGVLVILQLKYGVDLKQLSCIGAIGEKAAWTMIGIGTGIIAIDLLKLIVQQGRHILTLNKVRSNDVQAIGAPLLNQVQQLQRQLNNASTVIIPDLCQQLNTANTITIPNLEARLNTANTVTIPNLENQVQDVILISENLKKEIEKLKLQLEQAKQEVVTHKEKHEEAELKLQNVEKLEKQIEVLKLEVSKNEETQQKIVLLNQQLEQAKHEVEIHKEKHEEAELKLQNVEKLEKQIEILKSELQKKNLEAESLKGDLEQIEKEFNIKELQTQKQQLILKELNEELTTKIENAVKKVQLKDERISELEELVAQLELKLETQQNMHEETKSQLNLSNQISEVNNRRHSIGLDPISPLKTPTKQIQSKSPNKNMLTNLANQFKSKKREMFTSFKEEKSSILPDTKTENLEKMPLKELQIEQIDSLCIINNKNLGKLNLSQLEKNQKEAIHEQLKLKDNFGQTITAIYNEANGILSDAKKLKKQASKDLSKEIIELGLRSQKLGAWLTQIDENTDVKYDMMFKK